MNTTFQLLVPSSSQNSSNQQSIEVGGIQWVLTEPTLIPEEKGDYTCLSYACGDVTMPNPFNSAETIPARTLSAMETVIEHECPLALWVDTFCVPLEEPARSACLSQLGKIYAKAARVVVVLSESCFGALKQIQESGQVDTAALEILERDEWVSRVWTYQELINNSRIRFVAEGQGKVWAEAYDFLKDVACSIDKYRDDRGYNWFEIRALFPRVISLEGLIADWMIADYLERTAYQVISGMDHRSCRNPEEFYIAIIGAIDAPEAVAPSQSTLQLAEYFMQLCEAKGDYSFIYTTGPRIEAPGQRWRPKPVERLRTIFPWHSYGDGQSASIDENYIELKRMWKVEPGPIGPDAVKLLYGWLLKREIQESDENKPSILLEQLRKNGFSGCGEFVETEFGYFFPQSPLPGNEEPVLAVATGVKMTLGAPGLVLKSTDSEAYEFRDVGLFLGRIPKVVESLKVCS